VVKAAIGGLASFTGIRKLKVRFEALVVEYRGLWWMLTGELRPALDHALILASNHMVR
jgi:hypothetical protein